MPEAHAGDDDVVLTCRGLQVSTGGETLHHALELELRRGVTALLGPAGSGKSTLLRVLCGVAGPDIEVRGEIRYLGRSVDDAHRPVHVAQAVRTGDGAGRLAAIDAAIASSPALVCLDEPMRGLGDDEATEVMARIVREGARRAVLVVTHHQDRARRLADHVALLAGGRIIEHGDAASFFEAPATTAGELFVRTGGCALPSPSREAGELEEGWEGLQREAATRRSAAVPSHRPSFASASRGPRGFHWVVPGLVAGCAQPGLVRPVAYDLRALHAVGIRVLVTLTETRTVEDAALEEHGIEGWWLPIDDMSAPSESQAAELCARIARVTRAGRPVALHCKAGKGRTGTMLAAQLVYNGLRAEQAIVLVRRVEPSYIQSTEQEEFLTRFRRWLSERRYGYAG